MGRNMKVVPDSNISKSSEAADTRSSLRKRDGATDANGSWSAAKKLRAQRKEPV
jgi:hypothetical protein